MDIIGLIAPVRKKKMSKKIRSIFTTLLKVVCVLYLAFAVYKIGSFLWQLHNEKSQDEQVITEVKKATQEASNVASDDPSEPFTPDASTYGYMHGINSDYRGWLKWDSNIVNTYILQPSPESSDIYLDKNIYKNNVVGGSVFIDANASLDDQNIPIYGHSVFATETMTINMMLSPLGNFVKSNADSFFANNKTFKIYWEDHISSYEVFAACDIDINSNSWQYTQNNFDSEEETKEWIDIAKSLSSISSSLDVETSDRFVTFQTCLTKTGSHRVVIVAKETGESEY